MAKLLEYNIEPGSWHDAFHRSRAKIQFIGGGYANGKTTAMVIKGLQVARDYPGSNGLIARSTYPRLMDTIMKVWFKWMPKHWMNSNGFVKTPNPTLTLKNGSVVNFRHISQSGHGTGQDTTSNLLSATYDWIAVDQIEDPEITEKDFNDLLGRLRGDADYIGSDPTMPVAGPRWFMAACNPTRNWVYRKLVRPVHRHRAGIADNDLLVHPESGEPIIELFEGSTYTNARNLSKGGDDYISTLESAYKGQMRDRYLMGQWAAYEGLVYPDFDEQTHTMPRATMLDYLYELLTNDYEVEFLEGYDHGLRRQSCYLASFVDHRGNVFVFEGFYEVEHSVAKSARLIRAIRETYDFEPKVPCFADPAIFKRGGTSNAQVVGKAVSELFRDEQIVMQKGNNDVMNGINKVQSYLAIERYRRHPINGEIGSPAIFFANELDFVANEFGDYYWKKLSDDTDSDTPTDRNDHAMDTIKYMLSRRPPITKLVVPFHKRTPQYMRWQEFSRVKQDPRRHRHV